jgi:hypothetical protein
MLAGLFLASSLLLLVGAWSSLRGGQVRAATGWADRAMALACLQSLAGLVGAAGGLPGVGAASWPVTPWDVHVWMDSPPEWLLLSLAGGAGSIGAWTMLQAVESRRARPEAPDIVGSRLHHRRRG